MSQITYRANLSAKVFPFISEYFGRSIIVPGPDQNFSRQLTSNEDPDKDKGIPQVYYCHNVMPVGDGFQSVGYTEPIAAVSPTENHFINQFILRADTGSEVYFSSTEDGRNFVLPFGATFWTQINTIPGTAGKQVTIAFVNGQTYIYFASIGCFYYDAGLVQLVAVSLAGLTAADILGIVSSAGYMIAWSTAEVAWSSTIDPTDFVPSLITGAGGGSVETAKGRITVCTANSLGFIVYTVENAVAMLYSGNARYPFNAREIVNAGGLANLALVGYGADAGDAYAYTTSGVQIVATNGAKTVLSDVTDFLAGKYFEDFNVSTLAFTRTSLTNPMKKALSIVANRYVVFSCGIFEFTHALIYDTVQKRFGKLKITHASCFEWKLLTPEVNETPRESIGFLKNNGSISVVDFSFTSSTSSGVMLLGKYQYARSRLLTLDQVDVENVRQEDSFKLYNEYSVDGKNITDTVAGYLANDTGKLRSFNFRQTGINHTLVFVGGFYVTSLVLKFHINGKR